MTADMPTGVVQAYANLLAFALKHDSETSRDIGAILLSSYNYNIPGSEFRVGRFRNLDGPHRRAVLVYLEWIGSGFGLYPPANDMEKLKSAWERRGWTSTEHL